MTEKNVSPAVAVSRRTSTHAVAKTATPGPDFICQNHGSIFLLIPCSDAARIWVDEYLPPDRLTFGHGVVIEPKFIWSILLGLQDEGFQVVPR